MSLLSYRWSSLREKPADIGSNHDFERLAGLVTDNAVSRTTRMPQFSFLLI